MLDGRMLASPISSRGIEINQQSAFNNQHFH
jgi:hypothetical protein